MGESLKKVLISTAIFWPARSAARRRSSNETELPINSFPVECPYSIAQVLDAEFLPDAINL
ncbi:DUF29 family protein [Nostoc calcicola FACHB-3891]|nr:DUF29 family protein [Nostoc calcicola FACHB-3891]